MTANQVNKPETTLKAELKIDGKTFELPILTGTDGKSGIDIQNLYNSTGYITFDPGLYNTATNFSNISIKDPRKGMLSYRGYSIDDLTKNSTFVETAYILIYGKLPTVDEISNFSRNLSKNSMIHEDMANLFDGFPGKAHPLAILSVMITSLSTYYDSDDSASIEQVTRLLGTIRTMAAFSYKKLIGQPFIFPQAKLPYAENFLYMLFSTPSNPYSPPASHVKILNQLWILYAEHEQNVSTATVEIIGSIQANLFVAISAGITALWGTREGHKNSAAIALLEDIKRSGSDYKSYFDKYLDADIQNYPVGFGHTAYDVVSPRAIVGRKLFIDFYNNNPHDELTSLAIEIDDYILNHPVFQKKKFYPNLQYYSGAIFHSLGIPKEMFPVMQAIGKLPGWIAHWREIQLKHQYTYVRPKQIYDGVMNQTYIPREERR